MEVRNVQAIVLGQDGTDRLAEKGIHSREELVERVRDTFVPKRDSFEKLKVKDLSGCECYANYQITTPLPKSLFGDSFGYEMQKDIGKHMEAYYAGKMDDEELGQYFNACCTEMRKYQAQCHRASGDAEADNRKIISQVYEIFAKENARAARRANYDEGAAINGSYGGRNDDWVYYNADYYYQCADTKEKLGAMAGDMAGKWGTGSIDTEEIERNSDLNLDGGFDFNSGWNFTYRNQVGRASLADEATAPPRDFRFFYKEDVDNVAKMGMWIGGSRYEKDIPFYVTPDSLKGQLFQADRVMEEFEEETGHVEGYSDFMKQLSLFTGWYGWTTGINNRFGNYVPDDSYWEYG